jgi:hypothetical protein
VTLDLEVLPDLLAVCRLPAGARPPSWLAHDGFASVVWAEDETSVVCPETAVPADVVAEYGWRAIAVAGPLDFELTGVLHSIAAPLAEAGVSIFAVSTFDTDYVLVKDAALDTAVRVLEDAGHRVG